MRVISIHFDLSGDRGKQSEALAERIGDLSDLPLIVGGDLNSQYGLRDAAVKTVVSKIPMEACGEGLTRRWPLRLDRLAFFIGRPDFIFSSLESAGYKRSCRTFKDAYGSDHVPLLLTVSR